MILLPVGNRDSAWFDEECSETQIVGAEREREDMERWLDRRVLGRLRGRGTSEDALLKITHGGWDLGLWVCGLLFGFPAAF